MTLLGPRRICLRRRKSDVVPAGLWSRKYVHCCLQLDIQSLANSLTKLGHEFAWVNEPADIHKADVRTVPALTAS